MNISTQFIEITPNTWEEAKSIWNLISATYIYRGHTDSKWHLETTLARAISLNPNDTLDAYEVEQRILKMFKTRAHQYIESPPKDEDYVEWFSLIQDHGGPSRLLDFSESFYIASFFALESVREMGCVWAISRIRLLMAMIWGEKGKFANRIFANRNSSKVDYVDYGGEPEKLIRFAESFVSDKTNHEDLVLKVTPPRLNERLAVQKGIFLFPCNINKSFESNLCGTFELPFNSLDSENARGMSCQEFLNFYRENEEIQKGRNISMSEVIPIIKINLSKEISFDAITDLYNMNIDYASLFPGLDGFTKSLYYHAYAHRAKMITRVTLHYKDEGPRGDGSNSPVG